MSKCADCGFAGHILAEFGDGVGRCAYCHAEERVRRMAGVDDYV